MTAMRRILVAALIAAFGAGTPALANPASQDPAKVPAGQYVLDKRHASLVVKIAHMGGFSLYTMRFDGLDGGFAYDPANWRDTKLTITVDPKSIDTANPPFDRQITGYFEPDKYPAITFVSTAIQGGDGGKGQVTGDLTFHGVTHPVTLDVTFNGVGHGLTPFGVRLGFSGSTRIKRSDFGVTNMSQYAGDDVELTFEVEFEKK
jgi:polyisoprenoid-binding protein YceI